MCNFFLPPAIPLHFLFHFIFISSHPLSFTPLNYFHPSLLVLFHWYYPTNERKAAVLSRPNSGSCSPKQQWFMWPFFSFFLSTLECRRPTWLLLLCQQLPVLVLHTTASPSSRPQGPSQLCPPVHEAAAAGTLFAAEDLIISSSPSLSSSSLLHLLQSCTENLAHWSLWHCHQFMPLQQENVLLLIWSHLSWTWDREWRTAQVAIKCSIWDPSTVVLVFVWAFFLCCSFNYIFFLKDSASQICRDNMVSQVKTLEFL